MFNITPYSALCNLFRNKEVIRTYKEDGDISTPGNSVRKRSNFSQTKTPRDYTLNNIISSKKQNIKSSTLVVFPGLLHDDNFLILQPDYAAYSSKNITPVTTDTAYFSKTSRELPFTPIFNRKSVRKRDSYHVVKCKEDKSYIKSSKTFKKIFGSPYRKSVATSTTHLTDYSSRNRRTRENLTLDTDSYENLYECHRKNSFILNEIDDSVIRSRQSKRNKQFIESRVSSKMDLSLYSAVQRTLEEKHKERHHKRKHHDYDERCLCDECGVMGVISDSLRKPFLFEPHPELNITKISKPKPDSKFIVSTQDDKKYSKLLLKLNLMEDKIRELEETIKDPQRKNTTFETHSPFVENRLNCPSNFQRHSPPFKVNLKDIFNKKQCSDTAVECEKSDDDTNLNKVKQNNKSAGKQIPQPTRLRYHDYINRKKEAQTKKENFWKQAGPSNTDTIVHQTDSTNKNFQTLTSKEIEGAIQEFLKRTNVLTRVDSKVIKLTLESTLQKKFKEAHENCEPTFDESRTNIKTTELVEKKHSCLKKLPSKSGFNLSNYIPSRKSKQNEKRSEIATNNDDENYKTFEKYSTKEKLKLSKFNANNDKIKSKEKQVRFQNISIPVETDICINVSVDEKDRNFDKLTKTIIQKKLKTENEKKYQKIIEEETNFSSKTTISDSNSTISTCRQLFGKILNNNYVDNPKQNTLATPGTSRTSSLRSKSYKPVKNTSSVSSIAKEESVFNRYYLNRTLNSINITQNENGFQTKSNQTTNNINTKDDCDKKRPPTSSYAEIYKKKKALQKKLDMKLLCNQPNKKEQDNKPEEIGKANVKKPWKFSKSNILKKNNKKKVKNHDSTTSLQNKSSDELKNESNTNTKNESKVTEKKSSIISVIKKFSKNLLTRKKKAVSIKEEKKNYKDIYTKTKILRERSTEKYSDSKSETDSKHSCTYESSCEDYSGSEKSFRVEKTSIKKDKNNDQFVSKIPVRKKKFSKTSVKSNSNKNPKVVLSNNEEVKIKNKFKVKYQELKITKSDKTCSAKPVMYDIGTTISNHSISFKSSKEKGDFDMSSFVQGTSQNKKDKLCIETWTLSSITPIINKHISNTTIKNIIILNSTSESVSPIIYTPTTSNDLIKSTESANLHICTEVKGNVTPKNINDANFFLPPRLIPNEEGYISSDSSCGNSHYTSFSSKKCSNNSLSIIHEEQTAVVANASKNSIKSKFEDVNNRNQSNCVSSAEESSSSSCKDLHDSVSRRTITNLKCKPVESVKSSVGTSLMKVPKQENNVKSAKKLRTTVRKSNCSHKNITSSSEKSTNSSLSVHQTSNTSSQRKISPKPKYKVYCRNGKLGKLTKNVKKSQTKNYCCIVDDDFHWKQIKQDSVSSVDKKSSINSKKSDFSGKKIQRKEGNLTASEKKKFLYSTLNLLQNYRDILERKRTMKCCTN